MTSQPGHFFQASQTVHGADDVTTLPFLSQVNSLSVCGPQVDILIFLERAEVPDLIQLTLDWVRFLRAAIETGVSRKH